MHSMHGSSLLTFSSNCSWQAISREAATAADREDPRKADESRANLIGAASQLAVVEQQRGLLAKLIRTSIASDKTAKVDQITQKLAECDDPQRSKELFQAVNALRLINGAKLKRINVSPLPMLLTDNGTPANSPQDLVSIRKVHHQGKEMGADIAIGDILCRTQAIQAEVADSMPMVFEVPGGVFAKCLCSRGQTIAGTEGQSNFKGGHTKRTLIGCSPRRSDTLVAIDVQSDLVVANTVAVERRTGF